MALTPGTRLGVYEIAAQIGEGGMGQVYRARDTRLDRAVAIKILPEAFAHDAERLARFTREARTLASLNHPNIAAIYGLEQREGMTALVMELVEGDDYHGATAHAHRPAGWATPGLSGRQVGGLRHARRRRVGPRWRGDSKELIFVSEDRGLMSVDVKPGPAFEFTPPKPLLNADGAQINGASNYAVTSDGQRFLMRVSAPASTVGEQIYVVLNWPKLLRK